MTFGHEIKTCVGEVIGKQSGQASKHFTNRLALSFVLGLRSDGRGLDKYISGDAQSCM